ncbi:DUF4157 domain-containing protein [Microcoleus sp. FACHB-SPT15]|nr:DUF4157 domain-containing protein [Microcoleus sp. FACHB-SPT15]
MAPKPEEEEEPLQAKPLAGFTIQREMAPKPEEEEEPVQAKPLAGFTIQREMAPKPEEEEAPVQAKPLAGFTIQREVAPKPEEEEEPVQAKPLAGSTIQREMAPKPEEEEEPVQAKPLAGSTIQREMAPKPEEEEEPLQAKPLAGSTIQREMAPKPEEEEEPVQMKRSLQRVTEAGGNDAGSNLENRLSTSKGRGSPLSNEVRSFMEPRFGADFSQVRVHTDSQAVQMNKDLGAQAFTHGNDIYFGAGKSPIISDLTAHELTHVVQQTGAVQRKLPEGHNRALEHHQARDGVVIKSEPGTPQIQKSDPVSATSLGVAVFEAGRSYANSGNLYHNGNTPSYMHERTPIEATWEDVVTELNIQAFHPRIGWDNQDFYYRLSYQRNGYDIRNAQVDILRDKSSGMYTSTFGSTWSGQTHSRPTDTVAEIVFNISGEWNPHGVGHASWWGQLVLSAVKESSVIKSFTVGSEQDWVWRV